ncbi:hypothetical protein D9Q98_008099 [Chlorella vulgaris]|uniref:MARVEL domain-containing protein n=1 Tax=Chlorella vulgaris TaxID=3077 RepID=A0A9D4TG35_CHLVU|nr:hypothetical protein D9Q98_008099 [Chlorella vulgaris]
MVSREALRGTSYILALIQIAIAVAISIVVRQELWRYTGGWRWAPSWWAHTSPDNVCLMGSGSVNLCAFTYVVVAVSLAASVTLFITQCFPRGATRCCAALELWLAAFLTAWWAAAAATGTAYGVRADNSSPPMREQAARTAVWALAWAEMVLWGCSAALAAYTRFDLRRRRDDLEMSSSATGSSRYERYTDRTPSPFTDSASKWKEARSAHKVDRSKSDPIARQLEV